MDWRSRAWILASALALLGSAVSAQTPAPGTFGTIVVFRDDVSLARGAAGYSPDDRASANRPA